MEEYNANKYNARVNYWFVTSFRSFFLVAGRGRTEDRRLSDLKCMYCQKSLDIFDLFSLDTKQ